MIPKRQIRWVYFADEIHSEGAGGAGKEIGLCHPGNKVPQCEFSNQHMEHDVENTVS